MKVKEFKHQVSDEELLRMWDEVTIPSVFEEGIEKGIEKKTREIVMNMLNNLPEFSDEKIANLAGTNADFVKKCRQELAKSNKKN
ncbi:MAG: hypothetical protein R2830_17220 [Saprospiraceae bacterium]